GTYFENYLNAVTQFAETIQDTKLEKEEESKSLQDVLFKALEIIVAVGFPEAEIGELVTEIGAKALKEITAAVIEHGKDAMKDAPAKSTYHEYIFAIRDLGLDTKKKMLETINNSEDNLQQAFKDAATADFDRIQAKANSLSYAPELLAVMQDCAQALKATLDPWTFP